MKQSNVLINLTERVMVTVNEFMSKVTFVMICLHEVIKWRTHLATFDIACQTNYETDYRSKTLGKRGPMSFLLLSRFSLMNGAWNRGTVNTTT